MRCRQTDRGHGRVKVQGGSVGRRIDYITVMHMTQVVFNDMIFRV